jgi:two-component system chemotaxis response regulator CheY
MKTLIVEDDFICRNVLQKFLGPHGECDIAVNGKEAVKAFSIALQMGSRYDLICLDIMLPEMDGQAVLSSVRGIEKENGIGGHDGVKIIMTTALSDPKNVMQSFREQCDGYLVKPIDKAILMKMLAGLELLS